MVNILMKMEEPAETYEQLRERVKADIRLILETHILRNDNEQHKFIELNFLLLRRFFYAKN